MSNDLDFLCQAEHCVLVISCHTTILMYYYELLTSYIHIHIDRVTTDASHVFASYNVFIIQNIFLFSFFYSTLLYLSDKVFFL